MSTDYTFAVVLNRSVILSRLLVAVAEVSAKLGERCPPSVPRETAPRNALDRFIVLRADNSEQIASLHRAVAGTSVACAAATDDAMDPHGRTYLGLALYSPSDIVNRLICGFPGYTIPDITGPLTGITTENPNFEFFRKMGR